MLKHEFDELWSRQAESHPELTSALHDRLFGAMFFQRPLKPPVIGKCTFYPHETRLAKAHPMSQARRIYQDLNHLKYPRELGPWQSLTLDQRDRLAVFLMAGEHLTFAKMRKELKLPADTVFSIEEGAKLDKLIGNQIAERLGYKKGPLKDRWGDFRPEQREDVVERLTSEPDEAILTAYLGEVYGLSEETARATMKVRLPDGYDSLAPTATAKILAELKKEVVPYNVAVERGIGLHHSDERDGVIHDRLPYYGEVLERYTVGGTSDPKDSDDKRYGRLTNPTVHVAMNQLRRVVNALIELYGHPEQVVLELARDLKLSQKQKDELEKENRKNRDKNEARRKLLEEEGYVANFGNMMLLRLWEELGPPMQRCCIYTGQPISLHQLLSGDVEIEHILPYSRTLDDSFANKTLAFRSANQGKRNQAPCEAFRGTEYDEIRVRARALPPNKRWRFEPEAMDRFEGERDFLARQLKETRHLAKLARKYMVGISENPNDVWVVTGQLTALMRARFGLNGILSDHNQKNRTDHRHHAIDACVIGICDRSLLQMTVLAEMTPEPNRNGAGAQGTEGRVLAEMTPEPNRGMTQTGFGRRSNGAASNPASRPANRKVLIPYDKGSTNAGTRSNKFGKLKDWRRVHTRYDRCAYTFFSAIAIATTVIFWLQSMRPELVIPCFMSVFIVTGDYTMHYAILCYDSEAEVTAWTQERDAEVMQSLGLVCERLTGLGRMGPVARLMPTTAAVTLRKGRDTTIIDGPFAETKEQLLGFYTVECETLDEAIAIAKDLAAASGSAGCFEVRPMMVFIPDKRS